MTNFLFPKTIFLIYYLVVSGNIQDLLVVHSFCHPASFKSLRTFESKCKLLQCCSSHTYDNNNKLLNNRIISCGGTNDDNNQQREVTILSRGPHHVVATKPPSVLCRQGQKTASRAKRGEEPEIPMLQRVQDGIHDIYSRTQQTESDLSRKVNLVHELDRGASGALLFSFDEEKKEDSDRVADEGKQTSTCLTLTEMLISPESIHTYVALVRGEGVLRGEDLKEKGWFEVSRPGEDATTLFKFVAGQSEDGMDCPRMSLVLARPKTGSCQQIRRHLSGCLSHPILGDTTYGASKVNREWKEKRNLPGERICLHLGRIQLPPSKIMPNGLDVSCPMCFDMLEMLNVYAPDILQQSLPILKQEGILIDNNKDNNNYEVGKYTIPDSQIIDYDNYDDPVDILEQNDNYVIVEKPPCVVVHHSSWTRWRGQGDEKETTPMLQRVRNTTGRKVNLVHRLDRGASGCLLFSFSQSQKPCHVTSTLIHSMQGPQSKKTYIAFCDGDGTWNGINYLEKGWFTFDKAVKNEHGKLIEGCRTEICFVASTVVPPDYNDDPTKLEGRKISIVLAKPHTGRWHQVRQHLASGTIGHAILGDSSHGRSRTNRIWKTKRQLMPQRTCLHLARIQLEPTDYSPDGIDVSCPLSDDLQQLLNHLPSQLLEDARPILLQEGIQI